MIELILVIGLAAVIMTLDFENKKHEMQVSKAKGTGEILFQYNNAVRAWLSNNVGASAQVKDGTFWLKHTSCAGGMSSIAYLPCSFPDATEASPIPFGELSLTSHIESTGAYPNQITAVRSITSPFIIKGEKASGLSGVAAIVAAAGRTDAITPVLMASEGSFKSDPSTASITMIASNNASTDAWLRTDGSNYMNNNLTFNPFRNMENREIRNISRIVNLADGVIFAGSNGGALLATPERFIVDADEEILGVLKVENRKGNGVGLEVTRGNLNIPSGSLNASENVVGKIFRDIEDSAYYLDPNQTSVLNTIQAKGDVTSEQNMGAVAYYDKDDTTFYVDPDKLSELNEISAKGSVRVGDYLKLDKVSVLGESCTAAGIGSISRDASGMTLSCKDGVWSGAAGTKVVFSSTSGPYNFKLDSPGIIFADGHSFRKGGDVYTNIFINGTLCNRDRGFEAYSWNSYASASCTRYVPAGDYSVTFTERIQKSSVTALQL